MTLNATTCIKKIIALKIDQFDKFLDLISPTKKPMSKQEKKSNTLYLLHQQFQKEKKQITQKIKVILIAFQNREFIRDCNDCLQQNKLLPENAQFSLSTQLQQQATNSIKKCIKRQPITSNLATLWHYNKPYQKIYEKANDIVCKVISYFSCFLEKIDKIDNTHNLNYFCKLLKLTNIVNTKTTLIKALLKHPTFQNLLQLDNQIVSSHKKSVFDQHINDLASLSLLKNISPDSLQMLTNFQKKNVSLLVANWQSALNQSTSPIIEKLTAAALRHLQSYLKKSKS